ncbi:MAG: HDOD domain-containing protein [Bdellovibrionales bacterium]|nr:HDOD domain-containing protein [Bdellovibrionales bacterium]
MPVDNDQLIRLVDKMPAFPQGAQQIIALSNNVNCAPRDLVKVIEHDPVLTLKVLKLVNSSYFGLAQEVTSVNHAVVYLGINTVKNVALSVAALGALPKENSVGFDMPAFLWHSLVTGSVARLVSKLHRADEAGLSNAFVAGLIHDIGKIVFVQFLPNEYTACMRGIEGEGEPPVYVEAKMIGADHAQVGAMLAEKWQLPAELAEAIRHHHEIETRTELSLLEKALFVGNQVSKFVAPEGYPKAVYEPFPAHIEEWVGCTLEEVPATLPELKSEIEKAEVIINTGE